jgi:hypothetical protein
VSKKFRQGRASGDYRGRTATMRDCYGVLKDSDVGRTYPGCAGCR